MTVSDWLAGLGLECYAEAFLRADVDLEVLPELEEADLLALGVQSLGHRKKLLRAARTLVARGEAFVEELPAFVAHSMQDYFEEQSPLLKLWLACDTVEMALRFLFAIGLAERRSAGPLPPELLGGLRYRLEEPTLGRWCSMAELVATPAPDGAQVVPELPETVLRNLVPLLGGGRDPETSGLALRNRLAHGAGVSRGLAEHLLGLWKSRFDGSFRELAWMSTLQVVARSREGGLVLLKGSRRPYPAFDTGRTGLEAAFPHGDETVLVRGEDFLMLWPLALFGPPGEDPGEEAAQIYVRRGEVLLDFNPLAMERVSRSQVGGAPLASMRELFQPGEVGPEWQVRDFWPDLRREASSRVGRQAELETLMEAIQAADGEVLWLSGPAGSGKSCLVAAAAVELQANASPALVVLPYRFKAGDDRCRRSSFLQFAVERLESALQPDGPGLEERSEKLVDRLRRLLAGVEPRRVVFLLDGLDEIAESDPDFALEVPLRFQAKGVTWVCSGRPERGLPSLFQPGRCRVLFPAGLPPMGPEDIRTMVLERVGSARKHLLAGDREEGSVVGNPFLARVCARSEGLPLYVRYVIGDLLSGRLRALDAGERLPESLAEYHEELLLRCRVGTVAAAATPVVATLCVAHEAMAIEQLLEMLQDKFLLSQGPEAVEALRATLAHLGSMLRRSSTAEGNDGFTLYHHSLRQHLRESPSVSEALRGATAYLVHKCEAFLGGDVHAFAGYARRQGVRHLLEAGRLEAAVRLLHLAWNSHGGREGEIERCVEQAKALALAFREVGPLPGLDPGILVDVLQDLYEFELLYGPVRWIWHHSRDEWTMLLEKGNWDTMYTAALVMAEDYLQSGDPSVLQKVRDLASGRCQEVRGVALYEDTAPLELGLYALKRIGSHRPELVDLEVPARSELFVLRGIVLEILMLQAARGQQSRDLVQDAAFWEPRWESLRLRLADLEALERLLRGEEGSGAADRDLRATEALRLELLACVEESPLRGLLLEFYELPLQLERMRRAMDALRGHPRHQDILEVLFGSVHWEIGSTAAGLLAELAEGRPELRAWISTMLEHSNWRIRCAGIEAAYLGRGLDGAELLGRAIRTGVRDPNPLVRGFAAEGLSDWLVTLRDGARERRLREFREEINLLLLDGDIYPLEQVQFLLRTLSEGGEPVEEFQRDGVSPLLQGIEWIPMGRSELLRTLDRRCPGAPGRPRRN